MTDKFERHESYGMAVFSRLQRCGSVRLFGSAITDHPTTIELKIVPGKLEHHLSEDWFQGDSLPLMVVEFSAAQFAGLLTTMNVGSGVPCTIRSFNGQSVSEPPYRPMESEKVRTGFEEEMAQWGKKLRAQAKSLLELLNKPTINKADRVAIKGWVGTVVQEIESNIPFVLSQFQGAVDRTMAAGKAEIDAFITTMALKTGLKQLKSQQLLLTQGNQCRDRGR
jgi:hypothetical protein